MKEHFNKIFFVALLVIGGVFVFLSTLNQPIVEQHAIVQDWNECRTETGTMTIPGSSASADVTLGTAIADTSQAFLLLDVAGISGIRPQDDHMTTGYIANSTTLTFERGNADPSAAEVSYALVECFSNEFSVQRGEINLAAAAVTDTDTVTSVDTSKTMVLVSGRTDTSTNDERDALVTGEMQDATTVLVERNTSTGNAWVRYELVEFSGGGGATVQTDEVTFGNGASATDTITSVDTSRSWVYCSYDSNTNRERASSVGCELTDSTTVTFHRYASNNYSNRIRYYVVEFPEDTVSVQRGSEAFTGSTCLNNQQCNHDITIPTELVSVTKAFSFVTNTARATGTGYPRNRWIDSILNTTTIRTSNWRSTSAANDDNVKYWQVIEFPSEPIVDQAAYRWFLNDDSTDVGSPIISQDTAATLGSADPVRLRMLVDTSGGRLATSQFDFKLQFAAQSGSCDASFVGETYADVTGATVISYSDNATPADGAALATNANDPTFGGDTVVAQTYEELNDFTTTLDVDPGEVGLWDFSLVDNGSPNSTTYCFRVVETSGTLLDTYTVIPELTTFSGNVAPTGLFNSASQKTDGTGAVDISIEIDDGEDDDTKALIEFDTDATCDGPWTKATLNEIGGAAADFDDIGGSPSMVNLDAYQVGTTATRRIITTSGSNSVDFDWDSSSDAPGIDATYCLRLTANDDTSDQSPVATTTVAIDNADPVITSASLSPFAGTVTEGQVVTITIDMGEVGLTIGSAGCTVNARDVSGAISDEGDDTYKILYSAVQGDASWAAGALPVSCEFSDAAGNVTTVSAWTDGNTLAGDIANASGGGGGATLCPNITDVSFSVNGGAEVTGDLDVSVDVGQLGATEMILSESIAFIDSEWVPFSASSVFSLTGFEGKKTIYLQLRNDCRSGFLLFDEIEYIPGATGPDTEPSVVPIDPVDPSEPDDAVTPGGNEDGGVVARPEDQHSNVGGFIIVNSIVEDAIPSAVSFVTNLATSEDVYSGGSITFTGGPLDGQTRTILSFDPSSKKMTVDPPFTQPPNDGDAFTIIKSIVQIEVPSAPVVVTPTPSPEGPIVLIPLADEAVVQTLSTIDADLDDIQLRARTSDLAILQSDLEIASENILQTISASSVALSVSALEEIAKINDRDVTSFIDVQNKVADLRALSVLSRRLIEQGSVTPVAESYMTFGSLKMKYLFANPLPTPQSFNVSAFLPEEVRPEHIFASEGFSISFAQDADAYFAASTVEVDSNQVVSRSIEMHDIWMLSDVDVRALSSSADQLISLLDGTRYEPEGALLRSNIDSAVETILETQSESYVSPQEHILVYRANRDRFEMAQGDLEQLRMLTLRAEFGAFGGPNTLTMWLIALVLLLFVIFSGAFALLWHRETQLIRTLIASNKKGSKKKALKKLHSHRAFDWHEWIFKHWRIAMLFLALISAIAAGYFFGMEIDQMSMQEVIDIAESR